MLKVDLEKAHAALRQETLELRVERDRLRTENARYKNVAAAQVKAAEHLNAAIAASLGVYMYSGS